jgi:glycosyltransferase involved in cell wall biosynthesis
VQDGVEGWIVPIRSPVAIADALTKAAGNRAALAAMGNAASIRARSLTWLKFREGIAAAYRSMLGHSDRSVSQTIGTHQHDNQSTL